MLGISPISYNSQSHSPSFGYSKRDVDNDINFYKEQVEELDQFINENYIPDKMKKPFKFFRTIANGAIDGLAVFGSTLMLASFVKKSSAKINSNKYVKNAVEMAKPYAQKIPVALSYIKGQASKGLDELVDRNIISAKTEEKIKNAFKPLFDIHINSDKAVKSTATVLGIGSGITGAYETTMRDDIKNEDEYDNDEDFRDEADIDNNDFEYDDPDERSYRESA